MDDNEYFKEDFDPRTLKVAQLRGILNKHGIEYQSNSKKNELIRLFNQFVKKGDENTENPVESLQKEEVKNSDIRDITSDIEASKEKDLKKTKIASPGSDRKLRRNFRNHNTDSDSLDKSYSQGASESEYDIEPKKTGDIELSSDEDKETDNKPSQNVKFSHETSGDEEEEDKQSSFTKENVFQSHSESPNAITPVSGSKKRAREKDDVGNVLEKRLKSPSSSEKQKENQISPQVMGDAELFLEPGVSDSEEEDTFSKCISHQVKSPLRGRVSKEPKKKASSLRDTKSSPVIKSTRRKLRKRNIPSKHESSPIGGRISRHHTAVNQMANRSVDKMEERGLKSDTKDEDSDTRPSAHDIEEEGSSFNKILSNLLSNKDINEQLGITVRGRLPIPYNINNKPLKSEKESVHPVSPGRSRKNDKTDIKEERHKRHKKTAKTDAEESDDSDIDEERSNSKTNPPRDKQGTEKPDSDSLGRNSLGKIFQRLSYVKVLSLIFLWMVLLLGALFGFWYREQTFLVGYCGHEIYAPTIPELDDMPSWLVNLGTFIDDNLRPPCIPCPPHARCFKHLQLACYEDFVEYKPWYFDYSPIVNPDWRKCIPDTQKAEKLEIMIDVALDLLRSRNADKNCGRTPEDDFLAALTAKELHDLLFLMKAAYISNEEFEELWERSLIQLEKEPEIIVKNDKHFTSGSLYLTNQREKEEANKVLRSKAVSNLSLKCQIQNSIVETVMDKKVPIFSLLFSLVVLKLLQHKLKTVRKERQKVDDIYKEVIRRLKQQHQNSIRSLNILPKYVGSTQLRDLILTNETNLKYKLYLWNKVSHKVESNSNIRSQIVESHGEIMKVWEWITDIAVHE